MKNKTEYAGSVSADTERERTYGLSGAVIKWIAAITMLIDHIGAVVMEYGLYYQGGAAPFRRILAAGNGQWLYVLQRLMRMIGRPSFLLYSFLLVEGFIHTRSRKRYALQMFLFALISEIPFDLAVGNHWFDLSYQNVFFEFLIGLAVLAGMEQAGIRGKTPLAVESGKILSIASGCVAAVLIQCDYDYIGIIIIAAFYEFHKSRSERSLAAAVLGGLETLGLNYGAGALAAIPVWFYNGKRGNQRFKYLFYWFYPVHLTVLVLIRSYFLGIFPK